MCRVGNSARQQRLRCETAALKPRSPRLLGRANESGLRSRPCLAAQWCAERRVREDEALSNSSIADEGANRTDPGEASADRVGDRAHHDRGAALFLDAASTCSCQMPALWCRCQRSVQSRGSCSETNRRPTAALLRSREETNAHRRDKPMSTNTLLLIIVVILLLGGGGFYFR